jgi:uncharacterized lipoprotein YddW (UPF0748 family)
MKKRLILSILCLLFLFPQPAGSNEPVRRCLFVSVIQDPPVLSSRQEIAKLVDFAKKARINILFVQIYRANQAWFPSKIADHGPYDTCVKNVSEDPLGLLIKDAHAAGIEVHAWLNMLSLSKNSHAILLKKYGPGILTRNTKKKQSLKDYQIDNQYFLEPGDTRVRKELLAMVEEILKAYPGLDGVQFDYMRYPDTNPAYGYTKINIDRFKEATGLAAIEEGSAAWQDWKRAQVTEFLEALAKKARSIRPDIKVSATGCMPCSRAYYEAFQDWPSWIDRGIVDFVTIMSYSPYPLEFERWIRAARNKEIDFKKVNIGLCAYKLGRAPAAFKKELELSCNAGAGAFVIFHYGSLIQDPVLGNFLMATDKSQK